MHYLRRRAVSYALCGLAFFATCYMLSSLEAVAIKLYSDIVTMDCDKVIK